MYVFKNIFKMVGSPCIFYAADIKQLCFRSLKKKCLKDKFTLGLKTSGQADPEL